MKRFPRLLKENLAELTTDELARFVGGTDEPTDHCNPCTATWSCQDIKTLQCLQTRLCTA